MVKLWGWQLCPGDVVAMIDQDVKLLGMVDSEAYGDVWSVHWLEDDLINNCLFADEVLYEVKEVEE